MKRTIIASPYNGDIWTNLVYARQCMRDCVSRGEAPIAFHLLYPQILNDSVPEERDKGMVASWAWFRVAELLAVYTDLGISPGMQEDITCAEEVGLKIEHRTLKL